VSRALTNELKSVVATGTGRQIGDGTAPATPLLPYAVLYPIPSPSHDGDLSSPDRDRTWSYQFTSVGQTRDQTQWMADKIQDSIEGDTFAPAGITIMSLETATRGSVDRDDDTSKVTGTGDTASMLFYSVDTYDIHTTR
jgi:hypothetical protein